MSNNYYDIRVNDLVLEVHVRGVPTPTVLWERDGAEFTNGMDRVIIAREKDGVYKLSIHDPVKLDGGRWVITAKNKAGEDKAKHQVIFRGKEYYQHVSGICHADPKTFKEDNEYSAGKQQSRSRASSIMSVTSIHEVDQTVPITDDSSNLESKPDEETTETKTVETKAKPGKKEWRKKLSTLYSVQQPSTTEEMKTSKPLESKQKLSFETLLKNVTIVEGSQIKLVCSCVGPSPTIKWFKNNIPVVWSKTVKNDTKLGMGAIYFTTTTINDTGTYKCTASNNFGEVETSCLLTVYPAPQDQYEAPRFTKNVREHYDVQVNDLFLEVQVRGNPPPTIKWFRDGIELEDVEGDKFFLLREPDGIHKLTIHDPQRKDEGRYLCEAENIAGKDIIKHVVKKLNKEEYTHVHGITYHDPNIKKHETSKDKPLEETIAQAPREFVWMDDGSYYVRGHTPEYLWEWETDTSAESEYEPYQPAPDEIDVEPEEEDDREYEEWEIKPQPVVKHGPKIKKMRKKITDKHKKINEQESTILPDKPIDVESQKLINITLETDQVKDTETEVKELEKDRPEEKVESDTTTENPEEGIIKQITDDDEQAVRKEKYLRLFPELVPDTSIPEENKNILKFINELRDITVVEGKSAKLFCTVLGPKADIKWKKNGEPLEFSKNIKNQSHEGTGIVNIAKVSVSDEGVYTVVVKHKDSEITSQTKLTVIQKVELPKGTAPRFITGIKQHYDFRVDDLILETHIKGDGLLRVQWFLDGIQIENNDKYIQMRAPLGLYKLCIHNPQPRDSGNYLIRVYNDFGSEEQPYSLRIEGKKDIPSYGIFHADPKKQYKDEDVKTEPRKYREVVFLEDGTYYVRGQTPEKFWEWETDTSAESEYEEYVSTGEHETEEEENKDDTSEDEIENKDEHISLHEEEKHEVIVETQIAEDQEEEHSDYEEPIHVEIKKRGPKIKKMRKKITRMPLQLLPSRELKSDMESKVVTEPEAVVAKQPEMKLSKRIQLEQPQEVPLVIKPKRRPVEVNFISRMRSQTALKGKTVSLNCCCSDNQKLEVTWYKDGNKFEMNKRCVSDVHFGFITLEIYQTTVEDSGIYECHVKTANGEAKDSCKITVFELPDKQLCELVPPTFIHPLKETYHKESNDIHLETRVRGNPIPTFTWIYDGVFIHHSTDKYEIYNQHYYELGTNITTAKLIINNPQLRDSGKYTLIAKNEIQTVEVSHRLKVGLRTMDYKKKRMDDIVVENQAPRILPKPPTPEPEIVEQVLESTNDENVLEEDVEEKGEEDKNDEDEEDNAWS
ncbi:muscle M-line assembly protein unc-89-like [Toxorhynchites rutilus septentrionalis]|uniref:muscle M-line assembly protein unc-89-like n=1 Tax=Toxorhynchites rutilus septentrionalis TaxID=329112 RepID=UPI0024795F69|nr:muscle M-line assembly protein unc-89-like [Toxorhynchites rutilus septentrionalis]